MTASKAGNDFLRLIISNIDSFRFAFPILAFHQKIKLRSVFHHLNELIPHSAVTYVSTLPIMHQTLDAPLLLTEQQEPDLFKVFAHYLKFLPNAKTRCSSNRFAIVMNTERYWLSFIEKAALIVIICFVEPNFQYVTAGRLAMPAQIRNFLTTCNIEYRSSRCSFVQRFAPHDSIRQSIFIALLNYAELTYRREHHPALLPAINHVDVETRKRHVLLYFFTMCHETLTHLEVPKDNRLAFLRFMADIYLDGDTIGFNNDMCPEFKREENLLVDQTLEENPLFKTFVIRIIQRTTLVNKFLKTGNAAFTNVRNPHYPQHLVGVIPTIPVSTQLLDGLHTPLKTHKVQFVGPTQLVAVLMSQCELKILSEFESKIQRRQLQNSYLYGWVDCQLAIRMEKFFERQFAKLHVAVDNCWVSDMKHPNSNLIQSLLVMPRWAMVPLTLLSAVELLRHDLSQHFDVGAALVTAIPEIQADNEEGAFTPLTFMTVIVMLQRLLFSDQRLASKCADAPLLTSKSLARLSEYVFNHKFTHPKEKKEYRVATYFNRKKHKVEKHSSFGHFGSVLLSYAIRNYTELWITKSNYQLFVELVNGTHLREAEENADKRASIFESVVQTMREHVRDQRVFCCDETADEAVYQLMTPKDRGIYDTFMSHLLTPETIRLQYHPDIQFGLMSMICPKVDITRARFDTLFPYDNITRNAQVPNLVDKFVVNTRVFASRSINTKHSFNHEIDQAAALACLLIGGTVAVVSEELRNSVSQMLQTNHVFPKLCFDAETLMLLPEFVHPGEIVDPVVMSLIMQVQRNEDKRKLTRYHAMSPLFANVDPVVEKKRKLNSPMWSPNSPDYEPPSEPDDLKLRMNLDESSSDDESTTVSRRPPSFPRVSSPELGSSAYQDLR